MIAIAVASLFHVAASGGFGTAHGFLGPQIELRYGHLALDGGVGFLDAPYADIGEGVDFHMSPVLGLRYFFREEGDGAFVSLHASYFTDFVGAIGAESEQRNRQVYAAMVGYRLRPRLSTSPRPSPGLFLDAGIGLGVQILHRYGRQERPPAGPGLVDFDQTRVEFGWIWGYPIPPIVVAIGYEF
jgi:hypothetical protein